MALVPKITSPCPLRWQTAPSAGRDFCGQCERRVHNLDGMDEAQRRAFLDGCSGKVCVFYTVKRRSASPLMGVGLAAATVFASASLADDQQALTPGTYCELNEVIVTGGTEAGRQLEWIDEEEAAKAPKSELPQIAESDWLPSPAGSGDRDR